MDRRSAGSFSSRALVAGLLVASACLPLSVFAQEALPSTAAPVTLADVRQSSFRFTFNGAPFGQVLALDR